MNYGEIDKRSVTGYIKFVVMKHPKIKPVEHALVDDRIPGIPENLSCWEVGSYSSKKRSS